MGIDMLNQTVCIVAHFKEISLLFGRLNLSAAVRALAVCQLGFCPEGFAGSTVQPLIGSLVNISFVVQLLEYFCHLFFVIFICSPDKTVIRGIHQIPNVFHSSGNLVHILLGGDSGFLRLDLNLLSMLIRSGLKIDVIPLLTFKPGNAVCQYYLIGISNMRFP